MARISASGTPKNRGKSSEFYWTVQLAVEKSVFPRKTRTSSIWASTVRRKSGIPEIESAGERFIAKGAILNGSSEEIWTIDECSLLDLDKHELKRLCELLRWKFFGYGIVSGGVRWNSVRNRSAGAQWSGVWRLRGTAGLRERLGGRQVASVELTAGRDE